MFMKGTTFLLSLLFFSVSVVAQNSDCYKRLLQRGIEEFEKENYSQAILKWQTAKDNCPDVTANEKKMLDSWIAKANEKQKITSGDTTKISTNIKVITKRDTLIKTVLKRDTIYVVKKDTTYVDRPVEKIVYVDKPVEKIVYRDRPEPYHPYGKGKCKIVVYTSCSNGGTTKVWIDGNYAGSFSIYLATGSPSCDGSGFVSLVTISGKHHILAQDDSNREWDFHITVDEDECEKRKLTCN